MTKVLKKRIPTQKKYRRVWWRDKAMPYHRYLAERALGRPLPSTAIVHHIDGDKQNNDKTNLVVCQDHAYHMLIHKRTEDLFPGFLREGSLRYRS